MPAICQLCKAQRQLSAFFSLFQPYSVCAATYCDMLRHLHRIGSRHLPPLLMDVASQFGADAPAAFNISEGGGEIAEPKD